MKKNIFSILMVAVGLTGAFAFTSAKPNAILYHPNYDGSGNIISWSPVVGSFRCLTSDRTCTATFLNDDPEQAKLSETKGTFVQP